VTVGAGHPAQPGSKARSFSPPPVWSGPPSPAQPGTAVPARHFYAARWSTPPTGMKPAGRRLWRAVVENYDLDGHELAILGQAAPVADLSDDLNAIVAAEGVIEPGTGGAHPAAVEIRQQAIALAWLLSALRLPDADAGARTQHRGTHGVYSLRAVCPIPGRGVAGTARPSLGRRRRGRLSGSDQWDCRKPHFPDTVGHPPTTTGRNCLSQRCIRV
jgi:hypothetical protein